MRRVLDAIYDISGALAAAFLCAIFLIVLAQVGLNIADKFSELATGSAVGLVIPSYAEFAGYFLSAATFLAMAYSLRGGAHIRVNLLLTHLGEETRRLVEIGSTAAGALFSAYISYWMIMLTLEGYQYGDVSPGMISVKIWIPQLALVLGFVVLTICFVDAFFQLLRGEKPPHMDHEDDSQAAAELTGAVE